MRKRKKCLTKTKEKIKICEGILAKQLFSGNKRNKNKVEKKQKICQIKIGKMNNLAKKKKTKNKIHMTNNQQKTLITAKIK